MYDAIGPEYTLLRLYPEVNVAQLVAAARQRGVPLTVLDVDSPETPGLYTTKLVLSAPRSACGLAGRRGASTGR